MRFVRDLTTGGRDKVDEKGLISCVATISSPLTRNSDEVLEGRD